MMGGRPKWAGKMHAWLADTQYTALQRHTDKVHRGVKSAMYAVETCIENGQERLEDVGMWALCLYFGHEPIPDQCNKPEHDLCAYCRKPMPNSAHGPQY